MAKKVTLVSKDGSLTQEIEDTLVNRSDITRLKAAGWAPEKAKPASGGNGSGNGPNSGSGGPQDAQDSTNKKKEA